MLNECQSGGQRRTISSACCHGSTDLIAPAVGSARLAAHAQSPVVRHCFVFFKKLICVGPLFRVLVPDSPVCVVRGRGL